MAEKNVTRRQAVLIAAQEEVRGVDLDPGLQPIAFSKLVDWIWNEGLTKGRPEESADSDARSADLDGAESPLQRLAKALSVPVDVLGETFVVEEGRLAIALPASKLASTKKAATRELATLLVLALQLGMGEEWTSVGAIREECDEYGVLDVPNFAATISGMDDTLQLRGKGQGRVARLRRPGIDAGKELVLRFSGRAGGA